MHVYVFLLVSMLYIHVSLSRSRLCHALCDSWFYACMVTSVPPRVCLDVTTCEIHLCGIGVLDPHISPSLAMLICLPYLLCAPHGFACMVTSFPPRVHLDVTTCEIHLRGVGALDSHFSSLRPMLICLPCLLCATHLDFFASLHLCTPAYMFMHKSVSSILQSNGTMDTRSKPTFVLLGHPLLFDNMLFAPSCASYVCLPLFGIFR